jgi:3-oxoacyl-[acyl-carrier-protein] synthase III
MVDFSGREELGGIIYSTGTPYMCTGVMITQRGGIGLPDTASIFARNLGIERLEVVNSEVALTIIVNR